MKFKSTRGGITNVTLEHCLLSGYASDGGLFVPEHMPTVNENDLHEWKSLSFQDLCIQIVALFAGDEIPLEDLQKIVYAAFATFDVPEIVPVVKVGSSHIAELFHGSTLAFKDFGQQILCRLINFFAKKRNTHINLFCSTTGDTGPAAVSAVAGASRISIFCCFPKGQISRLQRRQMTTVSSQNVNVFTFEGGGDDMDAPIKQLTTDPSFVKLYRPCAVNSINLGRIVGQSVHFFWSYFRIIQQLNKKIGDKIVVCIPCGALGNVTAGLFSRRMGLPISYFFCGVNANDILHRAITKGQFYRRPIQKTLSEAINIEVPYNFERLLYYIMGQDSPRLAQWMKKMAKNNKNDVPPAELASMQAIFKTASISDNEVLATITNTWQNHNYLVDPNTAVALAAHAAIKKDQSFRNIFPVVVLSTAHPAKFEEVIRQALGDIFWQTHMTKPCKLMPAHALSIMDLPEVSIEVFQKGENWKQKLAQKVHRAHAKKKSKL